MKVFVYFFLTSILLTQSFTWAFGDEFDTTIRIPADAHLETCVYDNRCLLPTELTVCTGTKVTWINDGGGMYRVASGHVTKGTTGWIATGTEYFWSDFLEHNKTFSHQFVQPGIYEYYLYPLIFPHGKIIVEDTCELTSPYKQLKQGILPIDIQCKPNLILVQKYDGSPACITESTKQKLIERGWTKSLPPCTSERTACFNQESNMCDPSGWECDNGKVFSEIISLPESEKHSNTFPNISDRHIQITVGSMKKSQNLLSVMVFEESQRHTSANNIMFHKVTPLYSGTVSSDDPLYEFFKITSGQHENVTEKFRYVPTSTTLIAGENRERFSVYLPIKIPLKDSVRDSAIQFNYSLPYIRADSDDVYSLELLSLAPVDINISPNAEIIHDKIFVVSGFWFFDKMNNDNLTQKDKYDLYYGSMNSPITIRDLLVYDIKFKLD